MRTGLMVIVVPVMEEDGQLMFSEASVISAFMV